MKDSPKVSICVMPWGMLQEPALGPSILCSALKKSGIDAKVEYCNLYLLKYLKSTSYTRIADVFALNDFLFTKIFDEQIDKYQIRQLDNIVESLWNHNSDWKEDDGFKCKRDVKDYLIHIRNSVIPEYIEECTNLVLRRNPSLVGFSCLFDQTISSLALAKSIKQRRPDIMTVFGGYALKGELSQQIIDSFHFVDRVVIGPGESAIITLVNETVSKKHGLNLLKDSTQTRFVHYAEKVDIEDSPEPNFEDYQTVLKIFKSKYHIIIDWRVLPFETSRGCWWGAKSHCIFCGIDNEDMNYTFKSSGKVLKEIFQNMEKFNLSTTRFVDYILPKEYFKTLIPDLANYSNNVTFTCELKSRLEKKDIELLSDAGFMEIQPGIESFSTDILKRMKKGSTAAQNVLTMKLGLSKGIIVHYNFLFGFPFDTLDAYQEILEQLKNLFHLQPPSTVVEVLTTRFSPLQKGKVKGVKESTEAHHFYDLLFSKQFLEQSNFDLNSYCYYFEPQFNNHESLREIYSALIVEMQKWNKFFYQDNSAFLIYEVSPDGTFNFIDTRNNKLSYVSLNNLESQIYNLVNYEVKSQTAILKALMNRNEKKSIINAIDGLLIKGLIFKDGEALVGLGISRDSLKENSALEIAEAVS